MAAIKQTDEIQEYCAHGLRCNYKDTSCFRWHVGSICFFSMCYEKPNGSGICFKEEKCPLEHPTYLNDDIWQLKSGKIFYFRDPKYRPEDEPETTELTTAKPVIAEQLIKPNKKDARKAARKATQKPVSDEVWNGIVTQDTQNATISKAPTLVDMSTKSTWAGKVKTVKAEPANAEPVKAEQANAEPANTEPSNTEPVKAEPVKAEQDNAGKNKYSTQLEKITREFLEESFNPAQLTELQSSLEQEFAQIAAQLQILKSQSAKLRKIRNAHAAYYSKD